MKSSIEVAGPGSINIFLNHSGTLKIIKYILNKNTIRKEADSKIQVEFVSANPTAFLCWSKRGAIYGDDQNCLKRKATKFKRSTMSMMQEDR